MRIPSTSPTTLAFGATIDPYSPSSPHRGTDFAYTPDNIIYAPFSGQVILRPNNGNDGNGIYMYNGDQFHGMLHCSKYLVSDGDHVTEGQPIGIMGATGYAQGVHVHWCVKVNNEFIDPMSLIQGDDNMIQTEDDAAEVIRGVFKREPTDQEVKDLIGRDWKDALKIYRTTTAGQTVFAEVTNFPELQQQVATLHEAAQSSSDAKLKQLIADLQDTLSKFSKG